MSNTFDIHTHISSYVKSKKIDILTDDYGYSTYNHPNTTFQISNDLPEMMMKLSHSTLKVWFRIMTLLKRNHDPVYAVSVTLKIEDFNDVVGRTKYYSAIKELIEVKLLLPTPKKNLYMVSITHANKLFKPKMDL